MLALDLEYRPRTFSEVLGNSENVRVLLNRSRRKELADRCLMFAGQKGSGKTTLARIVARATICSDLRDGEPCNECDSCSGVLSGVSQDVIEIDAASNGSVDRIREIIAGLEYCSVTGNRSILILDEAHRLGPASQDALLKSMEERALLVIFCTTEPHKIRPALRDRLDEFPVRYPSALELTSRVRSILSLKSISLSEDSLSRIIRSVDCSPRLCLTSISRCVDVDGLEIKDATVRSILGTNNWDQIVELVYCISNNAPNRFSIFDSIGKVESTTYIRDELIKCITQGFRRYHNVVCSKEIKEFISSHNAHFWQQVADRLICLDRPILSDIEFILFHSNMKYEVQTLPLANHSITDVSKYQVQEPVVRHVEFEPAISSITSALSKTVPKTQVSSAKPLEIEGVKFSADERVSPLHDKITPSRGPTGISLEQQGPSVQFISDKVPMTTQEFARAFTERTFSGHE